MGDPQTDARAKLGLDAAQLHELRDFLAGKTFRVTIPCDHTHGRTEEWAGRRGMDMEDLVERLKALGGSCDCAVLAKVTPDRFGWPT